MNKEELICLPLGSADNSAFIERLRYHRIPDSIIEQMIRENLIFTAADTGEFFFRSKNRLYGEVLNADWSTTVYPKSSLKSFWSIKNVGADEHTERAIVCMSAMEAVCLYSLHQLQAQQCRANKNINNIDLYVQPTVYISVGSDFAEERIRLIRSSYGMRPLFIATPNTDEGNDVYEKCIDLHYTHEMRPKRMTWQEDLVNMLRTSGCVRKDDNMMNYTKRYDNDFDHEIIEDVVLGGNAKLHRFLNAGGCAYSAIYKDGVEAWSCERGHEAQMIKDWNERCRQKKNVWVPEEFVGD